MAFWIAHADTVTGARNVSTEVSLSPRPSRIAYPDAPTGSIIETAAGTSVQQMPSVDGRTRSWFWDKYPGYLPAYQTLWANIQPLRSRYRKIAGAATPYVYIKEDETQLLRTIAISGLTVTPTYPWLRCRVLEVSRQTLREDTGVVHYAITKLVFVIDDPAFNDFL